MFSVLSTPSDPYWYPQLHHDISRGRWLLDIHWLPSSRTRNGVQAHPSQWSRHSWTPWVILVMGQTLWLYFGAGVLCYKITEKGEAEDYFHTLNYTGYLVLALYFCWSIRTQCGMWPYPAIHFNFPADFMVKIAGWVRLKVHAKVNNNKNVRSIRIWADDYQVCKQEYYLFR